MAPAPKLGRSTAPTPQVPPGTVCPFAAVATKAAANDSPVPDRVVTREELGQHKTDQSCWVAYDGVVYDVTAFAQKKHPGKNLLVANSGRDLTDEFAGPHGPKTANVFAKLPAVGALEPTKKARMPRFVSPVGAQGKPEARFTVFNRSGDKVVYAVGRKEKVPAEQVAIHRQVRDWITGKGFPCVAAKIAMGRASYGVGVYPEPLGSAENGRRLARDLEAWIPYQTEQWKQGNHYTTFLAVFPEGAEDLASAQQFEDKLFAQLQHVHENDRAEWQGPTNPNEPRFKFEFGGRRYFVVGLSPKSPREGRTFAFPMLAFNAMDQFAALRATGEFDEITAATRRRDTKISGEINPNLTPAFPPKGPSSGVFEASGIDHHADGDWLPKLVVHKDPKDRAPAHRH